MSEKLRISVITVTYMNDCDLDKTLRSVSLLQNKPFELIVVDGAVSDTAKKIARNYSGCVNVKYIGVRDGGIYEGMNNGISEATGDAIHYLNSGDVVFGDPYNGWRVNQLLDVWIVHKGMRVGKVRPTLLNTHYCHQGLLFPNPHPEYDLGYNIASDYDLIRQVFPLGFKDFGKNCSGYVEYDYGGLSSIKRLERDVEVGRIVKVRSGWVVYFIFSLLSKFKNIIPYRLVLFYRKFFYRVNEWSCRDGR